jgi:hypothetical protein
LMFLTGNKHLKLPEDWTYVRQYTVKKS